MHESSRRKNPEGIWGLIEPRSLTDSLLKYIIDVFPFSRHDSARFSPPSGLEPLLQTSLNPARFEKALI